MAELLVESDQAEVLKVPAEVRNLELKERVLKAVRVTWPIFAVAVVAVFIPMVHFVLVPAALLVMIFFGVRELTTRKSYSAVNLKCPHCQTSYGDTEIVRLPKRITCFSCRVTSTVMALTE